MNIMDIDIGITNVPDLFPYWVLMIVVALVPSLLLLGSRRKGSLDWTLAYGYVAAWRLVYRIEESRLLFCSLETAIAEASVDENRLLSSTMSGAGNLLFELRQARAILIRAGELNQIWNLPLPNQPASPAVSNPAPPTPGDELLARESLQAVRRAINNFREHNWSGIIRARNRLNGSIFVTSGFTLMLIGFCIVVSQQSDSFEQKNLIAGLAFYFSGAMIGVLNQLRLDRDADSAVEDYGLGWSRRINTPLLSGLFGLAAVILIPMLAALADGKAIPRLHELLDLKEYPRGIALAAIFGLTPSALIDRLQSESEKYKTAITKSQASGGSTA